MRPLRLRMRGLTRYREPVDLDLSTLPPGLIAIVGPNGEGKTTLMDCLGPVPLYRRLSTRAGPLKDWCQGRDTQVDLEVAFRGRTYRLLLNVDPEYSKGTGKEEAFLYEDDVPLTPGRVTDYDEAIARIFPSRDIFLASAFGAQNREGNFLAMRTPAGGPDVRRRKELFAELLGLCHLQALAARAGAARQPLDAAAADLDREGARLAEDQLAATSLRTEVERATLALAEARGVEGLAEFAATRARDDASAAAALRDQLENAVKQAEARVDQLRRAEAGARADADLTRTAIAQAEGTAAGEATIRQRAADLAGALIDKDQAGREWMAAEAQVKALVRARDDIASAITRAQADAERADATLRSSAEARSKIAPLREQVSRLSPSRQRVTSLDRQVREEEPLARMDTRNADAEVGAADILVRDAARSIDAAERQAALLGGVPCKAQVLQTPEGGTRDCGACKFLTEATAGAATLPQLRADLYAARTRLAAGEDLRARAHERSEALTAKREQLAQAQREALELSRLEADVARLEAAAASADTAEGAKTEALARRAQLDAEIVTREAELATATEEREAVTVRGRTAASRCTSLAGADAALRALEDALARLPLFREQLDAAVRRETEATRERSQVVIPPPPAEQRDAAARADFGARLAAEEYRKAREALREADGAVQHAQGRLAQLGDLEARASALAGRRERVALRRSGFVLLENAFGRDGIQALEIDAAGPEVSGLCNELLDACFGPRFTVALRTIQEATKTRKQQEVFDLTVHDGLRGRNGSADGLSGGEQVLINEALRLALAIFNARRHGNLFEVLYRDEADTGLSEDLRAMFPPMLRRGLALGGFRNLYFITHHREAWEQADAILRVEDGRVSIELA